MTPQLAIAIALHQLATVAWVGGMFFAHVALRPSVQRLEPPQRLALLLGVFDRFFPWVWASVVVLWASGLWLFLGIYQGAMGWHVHAMMGIALIMTALFVYLYFQPYHAMGKAVAAEDWPQAAARLTLIRRIILVNLVLGLVTAALGATGRLLQ